MDYTEEQIKKPKSFLEINKKEMNAFEWYIYQFDIYYEQNKEWIDREKKERLKKESSYWWKANRRLEEIIHDYPILVFPVACTPVIVAVLLMYLLGIR